MWATPRSHRIGVGDDLFFWKAKEGLIAHWRATADEAVVSDPATLPWPDSVEMKYTRKFPMVEVATLTEPVSPWGRVRDLIGTKAGPNLGVIPVNDPAARNRLAALFTASTEPSVAEVALGVEVARARIDNEQDARTFVECQGPSGTARGRSRDLPVGGHGICPVVATRGARWWPWDLLAGGHHRVVG